MVSVMVVMVLLVEVAGESVGFLGPKSAAELEEETPRQRYNARGAQPKPKARGLPACACLSACLILASNRKSASDVEAFLDSPLSVWPVG